MIRLSQLIQKSLIKTPSFRFSQVDHYLNKLEKPLYYYIIGANLGVFLLWNLPMVDMSFMYRNFTLSQEGLRNGRFHTLITHAFSHQDFMHFGNIKSLIRKTAFNMVTFYFLGREVERNFGSKCLMKLYLLGIVGGVMLTNYQNGFTFLGASASINAIITYYIQIIYLFILPVPAWALGLLLFWQSWSQASYNGGHLGGILAGGAYFFLTSRGLRF